MRWKIGKPLANRLQQIAKNTANDRKHREHCNKQKTSKSYFPDDNPAINLLRVDAHITYGQI